jgi:hypothetical protein
MVPLVDEFIFPFNITTYMLNRYEWFIFIYIFILFSLAVTLLLFHTSRNKKPIADGENDPVASLKVLPSICPAILAEMRAYCLCIASTCILALNWRAISSRKYAVNYNFMETLYTARRLYSVTLRQYFLWLHRGCTTLTWMWVENGLARIWVLRICFLRTLF